MPIFVEFGATNGLTNSSTWLLENHFGWSGILAEPNSVCHDELGRNRNLHHRPVLRLVSPDDPELVAIFATASLDHFTEI